MSGIVSPLEFHTPGLEDFKFGGTFGVAWMDKPFWQVIIAFLVVIVFWVWMSRGLKVVPGKRQVFGEYCYNFIRNSLARDFSFILINNWFGELFVFMFPTFSHVGYVYGLAIVSWFVYVIAGFKTKGIRYLKDSVLPPGVPWYLRWLIIPLEFLSNFVTRPLTLSLRLFANMVAGHLIIMIFVVGGGFLLTYPSSIIYNVAGGLSLILSFALFALELFVGFLQAYVFTVLSAQYVASSMSEEH